MTLRFKGTRPVEFSHQAATKVAVFFTEVEEKHKILVKWNEEGLAETSCSHFPSVLAGSKRYRSPYQEARATHAFLEKDLCSG